MTNLNLEDQAYLEMIADLNEKFIPAVTRGKSKEKQNQAFAENLKRNTGRITTTDTIETYRQATGFNSKWYFGDELAGAWLAEHNRLPVEELRNYFSSKKKDTAFFWKKYFTDYPYGSFKTLEPKPAFVAVEAGVAELAEKFPVPHFSGTDPRKILLNDFLQRANKKESRLIIIESLPNMGKSLFLKCIAEKAMSQLPYSAVLWKTVEPGYSLKFFLNEFDNGNKKSVASDLSQANKMFNTLNSKKLILILDGFENALADSFRDFFGQIADWDGDIRIILASNKKHEFKFLGEKNLFSLRSYERDEFVGLAREMGIEIEFPVLEKLWEKTAGLPYYATLVLKKIRFDSYLLDIEKLFKEMNESKDFQGWINSLLSKVDEAESELLQALSIFGADITKSVLGYLTDVLQIKYADETINKLLEEGLLVDSDRGSFEVLVAVRNYFAGGRFTDENSKLHRMIAAYYWPSLKFYSKKEYSDQEIKNITKAITHFQLAGDFESSGTCLKALIPVLKRHGFYNTLRILLQFELDTNPDYDRWLDYHYAYWAFVTGQTETGYFAIRKCLDKALLTLQEPGSKDNVDFSLKTAQLFADYIARLVSMDKAVITLSAALGTFPPESIGWDARIQAISALSWFYIHTGELPKGMEINFNILHDCLVNTDQTKAVSLTRLGVIHCKQEDYRRAKTCLEEAASLFTGFVDRRGLAWCHTHLVFCEFMISGTPDLSMINQVLEFNIQDSLYDPGYQEWVAFFKTKVIDNKISGLLKNEDARLKKTVIQMKKSLPQEKLISDIDQLLREINDFRDTGFNYKQYVHPFESNAIPVVSIAAETYIVKVKRIPLPYFEDLFGRKTPHQIFSYHLFNRVIADCLVLPDSGIKIFEKYIEPNFNYLKRSTDSVRLHYAYTLQHMALPNRSLELLSLVSATERHVKYHRIMGNCYYSFGEFNKSYGHYRTALAHPDASGKEQGALNHNIARLIVDSGTGKRFREAKKRCRKAIRFAEDRMACMYAIGILFKITAIESRKDYLVQNLQNLIADEKIDAKELADLIKAQEPRQRYLLKRELRPYIDLRTV
jgi:tetratricopeptide (TPR) repeat protein